MKAVKAIFQDQGNKITVCKIGGSSDNYIAYKKYLPKRGIEKSTPVILLHELFRVKETWDECGQCIADKTGSKAYALDARNHGDSKWTDTMDYDSMADDIVQFMDNMDIQKAFIVGHGMGGKAGIVLALKHPERVQSLILEDTSHKSHLKSREQLMWNWENFRDILEFIPPNVGLKEAKKMAVSCMVVRHYYLTIKRRRNKPRIWDGRDLPLTKKAGGGFEWNLNIKLIVENMSNASLRLPAGIFDGPVLVIYGTHSTNDVLDDGRVEFLKLFPRALYEPIEEGVSYSLHIEYPDMFSNLVCDFILKQRAEAT